MRCVRPDYLGAVALALALGGCTSPDTAGRVSGSSQTQSPVGELVTSRPALPAPDTTALVSYVAPADGSVTSRAYRVIKPQEAQCAASAQCPVANALWYESQVVGSQAGKHHKARNSAEVIQQALAYRAADQRNRAAGQALEVFYLLAEAEANRDLLARSKTQIDAMLADVRDLASRGIRVEKGTAEIRRQQLELMDRQAALQLSLAQANSRLRQLMGLSFDEPSPLWRDADLRVSVEPIDTNAAVSEGLYRRADLNLLRMLLQSLDADTLDGVRSSLAVITGGSGPRPVLACLLSAKAASEVESRRCQLNDLLARQELAAAEEIRQAVLTVNIRVEQIAVAKQTIDHYRDQLKTQRLSRQRPGSTVTTLDIAATELKLLDARRELAHQVMAWRIAQAKLKEAQGLLVFECACR
jgi:hypothetical protein